MRKKRYFVLMSAVFALLGSAVEAKESGLFQKQELLSFVHESKGVSEQKNVSMSLLLNSRGEIENVRFSNSALPHSIENLVAWPVPIHSFKSESGMEWSDVILRLNPGFDKKLGGTLMIQWAQAKSFGMPLATDMKSVSLNLERRPNGKWILKRGGEQVKKVLLTQDSADGSIDELSMVTAVAQESSSDFADLKTKETETSESKASFPRPLSAQGAW